MECGNGNPMTSAHLDALYQCLRGALDPGTQKQAEAALEEFAARPGCCSCLVEIIEAKEVEESSQWLASVHLKNIISKSWRTRRDQSGLSLSEKEYLRPKLIGLLSQQDKKVNILFSKIARFDFPSHWPNMLMDIFATMKGSEDVENVHRVFLVLQHILKELSTKRLPADQKLLVEVTQQLFDPFWQQWCSDSRVVVECAQKITNMMALDDTAGAILSRWTVLGKALKRMLMFGISSDVRTLEVSSTVEQSLPMMVNILQSLLHHKQQKSNHAFQKDLGRGVVKLVKYLCKLQEIHPWAYCKAGVLIPLLELFSNEISSLEYPRHPVGGGVVLHGAIFIQNVLECKAYKGKSSPLSMSDNCQTQEKQLKDLSAAIGPSIANFFGGGQAQALMQKIIEKCFKLTADDILEWSNDPEAFYHQFDTALQTTETVRGASGALFAALFKAFREQLCPAVVSALETVSTHCPVGVVPANPSEPGAICEPVLEKEAVYHSVAVAAYDLYDYIEFSSWCNSTLLQEVDNKNPQLWPLRRAAAILLGAWVSKLKDDDRKLSYQALLSLLSEQDLCLKLTAVDVLRILIDDWAFKEGDFVEYGGQAIEVLARILDESSDLETQTKAFGLVNLIVERMGDEVKHLAEGLVQLLPRVWSRAEGQSLLRMQVLTTYQHLLNAIGSETPKMFPWLIPVIAYSVNVNEPESLTLLEDGLNLWLVTLRNTPDNQGAALLELFPHVLELLQRSTGELWVCMQILASCIYLGGQAFVSRYSSDISLRFLDLVGNVRDGAYRIIAPTVEVLLKIAPAEGMVLLGKTLVKLSKELLEPCAGDSGLVRGPNTIVFSAVIGVFSRAILWAPTCLLEMLTNASVAAEFGISNGEEVFFAFLDLWMDQFDSIASESTRKLSACALSSLLTLPLPGILKRLDSLLANMTTVCEEFGEGAVHDSKIDTLGSYSFDFHAGGGQGASMEGTIVQSESAAPECERKKTVAENDPLNTVKVNLFLKEKLGIALKVHGESLTRAFNELDENLQRTVKLLMES